MFKIRYYWVSGRSIPTPLLSIAVLLAMVLQLPFVSAAFAANPPPVQHYYIPLPEEQLLRCIGQPLRAESQKLQLGGIDMGEQGNPPQQIHFILQQAQFPLPRLRPRWFLIEPN